MSDEKQYPSLGQQAKNLANFSWQLVQYIHKNQNTSIVISDEAYKERTAICKACERFDDLENRCMECGCYVPAKARIIIDSCPLNKWRDMSEEWKQAFDNIMQNIEPDKENNE